MLLLFSIFSLSLCFLYNSQSLLQEEREKQKSPIFWLSPQLLTVGRDGPSPVLDPRTQSRSPVVSSNPASRIISDAWSAGTEADQEQMGDSVQAFHVHITPQVAFFLLCQTPTCILFLYVCFNLYHFLPSANFIVFLNSLRYNCYIVFEILFDIDLQCCKLSSQICLSCTP